MKTEQVHLLIVVVHDLQRLPQLLRVWQDIGVPGATILTSTGAYRATWLSRIGLGVLERRSEDEEAGQRTLLVAIEGEELLARAIAEAERVMDGFDRPHSGLLLVLPVHQVRGLHKVQAKPIPESLPDAVQPEWVVRRDTRIAQVLSILSLEPTLVHPDASLQEVARSMCLRHNTHLACVVDENGRLVGVLDLQTLADDLFFYITPEEFLTEITDLDEMMRFAQRSGVRLARDAMQKPVWVKPTDTVKDAFRRMHDHHLPGLPVVDDSYRVIGYINLLGLIASCTDGSQQEGQGQEEDK